MSFFRLKQSRSANFFPVMGAWRVESASLIEVTHDHFGWRPENEPKYIAGSETGLFYPNQTPSRAGSAHAANAIWDAIEDRPDIPNMVGSEVENINFEGRVISVG
jgi:hypothetical protein